MAKITLPTIAAGFASNSAFNTAYDLIEAEFQNKVLYRNNTSGEANKMEQALDMDSEAINNCGMLTATGLTIGGVSLTAKVAAAAASATAAAASASAAAGSATAAANSFDSFDDRYLGAKSSNPSTDNDGNALITGAIYFNSSSSQILSWTSGDAWVAIKPTSTEQTAITAVAADATDIGAVAGKATEIGRLGTSAAVADLALLGTSAVVADMALLASTAVIADMAILGSDVVIADMAILGTAPIIADMAILGTTDVVNDMNVLGTSAVVADMNLLGTSANVTNMAAIGASGVITNIATVSNNVAGVNSFADLYRGALSSNPGGTITQGSLYYNTNSPKQLKIYNGSAWVEAAFSADGAVSSFNGRNGSVTLTSADVVGALATGAIATAKLANDAVTVDKIANNAIIAVGLANNAVTTDKINGDAIINSKIADDAVDTENIADDAITAALIDDNAVGAAALNVSGTGSLGQALASDGDGTMTWTTIEGASAGGAIYENTNSIASNFTLASNKNGMSVGPITIASGVTVTVPSGANWVVL